MNVDPLAPSPMVPMVPPPLDRLAACRHLDESQKVAEAARQFEALWLRQILRETQKPVIPSSLVEDSTSTALYRDLFCEHLADAVARSGVLGLASTLQQQLDPRARSSGSAASASAPGATAVWPPAPTADPSPSPPSANTPLPARGTPAVGLP